MSHLPIAKLLFHSSCAVPRRTKTAPKRSWLYVVQPVLFPPQGQGISVHLHIEHIPLHDGLVRWIYLFHEGKLRVQSILKRQRLTAALDSMVLLLLSPPFPPPVVRLHTAQRLVRLVVQPHQYLSPQHLLGDAGVVGRHGSGTASSSLGKEARQPVPFHVDRGGVFLEGHGRHLFVVRRALGDRRDKVVRGDSPLNGMAEHD
mmetsp:Transcript_429/g.1296  ORF Transcript_429/g.1296 Transcript_429/m.1296 type:complete len:202 (+) Transcript_429:48-653(+)